MSALYLSSNKLTDVTPLAGLTKLSSLYVDHNDLQNIDVLTKVSRLSSLDLSDNKLVDLKSLTKQTELGTLLLENNKIADLAPLLPWAKKDAEGDKRFAPYLRLYLKGNPLSDVAKTKQIAELKSYGVRVHE
jgi:hypothetical protein